jgi:hypothetical protein
LRCGDAVAAKKALDVASSTHEGAIEVPVRNVISLMSQRQGNFSCLWESGPPTLSTQDRQTIADLYDRANNLEPGNIYRMGTLALLSGIKSLPSTDARGFSTIEDYLFGCLWRAVQDQNPMNEIAKLGELIQTFGPQHFNDEETGGWSYALPLLASQQFKTALAHLADAGGPTGLLQATHLGLVLSFAGVAVDDVGHDVSPQCIVTLLLVAYVSKLPTATAALEYLLRIPKKDRARKEVSVSVTREECCFLEFAILTSKCVPYFIRKIASLIVRSYGTEQRLAGTLSADGVRQDSILDKHFSREEVSQVIAEAAEKFRKEAYDRSKAEAAAMLYMLAGRYSSVLMLLNELMAPPDQLDDNRK